MEKKIKIAEGMQFKRAIDGSIMKVMAVRGNCVMARFKGCIPFVIYIKDVDKFYTHHPHQ